MNSYALLPNPILLALLLHLHFFRLLILLLRRLPPHLQSRLQSHLLHQQLLRLLLEYQNPGMHQLNRKRHLQPGFRMCVPLIRQLLVLRFLLLCFLHLRFLHLRFLHLRFLLLRFLLLRFLLLRFLHLRFLRLCFLRYQCLH